MDPLFNWLKDHYDMKGNVALGWVLAIAGASLISALLAALVSETSFDCRQSINFQCQIHFIHL